MVDNRASSLFTVTNPEKIKLKLLGKFYKYLPSDVFLGVGDLLPPGAAYYHYLVTGRPIGLPKLINARENTSIELKLNQIPVVNDCKNIRCGLVEFKTGGGKSVIIAALHQIWGGKTLIVVHSLDMVSQFKETFKKFLTIDPGAYYTFEKNLLNVTITTFNSATSKQEIFEEYGFDNLIIDEADEFFTKKRREFVCTFKAIRKFGFTGTIRTKFDEHLKSNKDLPCLVRFYGKHITGIENKDNNPLSSINFRVGTTSCYTTNIVGESVKIKIGDWLLFREKLDTDIGRKREQAKYILENHNESDSTLVLFDRIADVDAFHELLLKYHKKVFKTYGETKKTIRERDKRKFNDYGGIMIAHTKVTGRGWDCPNCNKVFILFPLKGESVLRQIVGRIVRWTPGKKSHVYDWVDQSLYNQFKKRYNTYVEFFKLIPKQI